MASLFEMRSVSRLDSNNLRLRVFLPVVNPLNCPCSVLRDQWLRVVGRTSERWKVGWITYIAESDTHIAQKPATLDPKNRRTTEEATEFRFIPEKESGERRQLPALELADW